MMRMTLLEILGFSVYNIFVLVNFFLDRYQSL